MEKRAKKYYAFRAQKVEDLKGAEKKAAKARGYKPEDWVMIMLSYNNRVLKFDVKKIDSEMLIGLKADLEAENFSISKRIDNIYISTKAGLRLNKEEFYKKNEARTREFAKNMSAYELYVHLLDRIVNSPSKFYADGVVIMIVPILFEKCAD